MTELMRLRLELAEKERSILHIKERINMLEGAKEVKDYPVELVDIGEWVANKEVEGAEIELHHLYAQLVMTCKEYNKEDGFVPDYNNFRQDKWSLELTSSGLTLSKHTTWSKLIFFGDYNTGKVFMEIFKEPLKKVQKFL